MHSSGLVITKEQHKALIDASNLLCEFVSVNLPDGWDIRLTMRKDEAEIELIDANGTERFVDSADYGISTIAQMCDAAQELDQTETE